MGHRKLVVRRLRFLPAFLAVGPLIFSVACQLAKTTAIIVIANGTASGTASGNRSIVSNLRSGFDGHASLSVASFQKEGLGLPGSVREWVDSERPEIRFSSPESGLAPFITFADEGIHLKPVVRFREGETLSYRGPELVGGAVLLVFRSDKGGTLLSSPDGVKLELSPDSHSGAIRFSFYQNWSNSQEFIESDPGFSFDDRRPHLVAITQDENGSRIYVDGRLHASQPRSASAIGGTRWFLGGDSDGENGFDGDVGGLWFLKEALSPEALTQSMCATMAAFDIPSADLTACPQ